MKVYSLTLQMNSAAHWFRGILKEIIRQKFSRSASVRNDELNKIFFKVTEEITLNNGEDMEPQRLSHVSGGRV